MTFLFIALILFALLALYQLGRVVRERDDAIARHDVAMKDKDYWMCDCLRLRKFIRTNGLKVPIPEKTT